MEKSNISPNNIKKFISVVNKTPVLTPVPAHTPVLTPTPTPTPTPTRSPTCYYML